MHKQRGQHCCTCTTGRDIDHPGIVRTEIKKREEDRNMIFNMAVHNTPHELNSPTMQGQHQKIQPLALHGLLNLRRAAIQKLAPSASCLRRNLEKYVLTKRIQNRAVELENNQTHAKKNEPIATGARTRTPKTTNNQNVQGHVVNVAKEHPTLLAHAL
jgi:hypothetical protein